MIASSNLISSASAYVKITPSGIKANLVPYGTSMITHAYEQNLILDPGTYSIDLDGYIFHATVSHFISVHLTFFVVRTGHMNITVEFMVFMIFPIFMDHY
jgi:hypothetical protein